MPTPSYKNRVGVASATTGTGTQTLGATESGYQGFAAGDDGKYFDVVIEDGAAWEVARDCLYTHSGTTLARGTLEASSTGSALSLTGSQKIYVTETAERISRDAIALGAITPGGRLTLESGVPVSSSNQIAKTDIYYTPTIHNVIVLWDGASWVPVEFAEYTLALGTLTASKNYDVFAYLSSGALALEVLVWTDDSTRATAVTLQDGRYCKSGDKTRLLLGTFYTSSTTTTEDSANNRYVGNVYNKLRRYVNASSTSSHTYTTATMREFNNGTGVTRGNFVTSIGPENVDTSLMMIMTRSAGVAGYMAALIDTTSATPDMGNSLFYSGTYIQTNASATFQLATVGKHYITIGEIGQSSVTYNSANARLSLEM